jgi:hypothetical protein
VNRNGCRATGVATFYEDDITEQQHPAGTYMAGTTWATPHPATSQVGIAHEFGHALGLNHPGQNLPPIARPFPGTYDDYAADATSIMGMGMSVRAADCERAFGSRVVSPDPATPWNGTWQGTNAPRP